MSESFIKADIFFVITAAAVVVVSVGLAVALVYIIRILRNVDDLSLKAKEEGTRILEDVKILREQTEEKAGLFTRLASSVVLAGIQKFTGKRVAKKKNNKV